VFAAGVELFAATLPPSYPAALAKIFRKELALPAHSEGVPFACAPLSGVAMAQPEFGRADDEITRYATAIEWPNHLTV
jgi:hypothetical protein